VRHAWTRGDILLRREILGLNPDGLATPPGVSWARRPWAALPVFLVEDTPAALVTYLASGAEFGFYPGEWPIAGGVHPWTRQESWRGHGVLMVQEPGKHYAVWHFWEGEKRSFACWYLNLQTAFVRTEVGFDTQDLELDVIVFPDGSWVVKDRDILDIRLEEGRFTPELHERILEIGDELTTRLAAEGPWWDRSWAEWEPDPSWQQPKLPPGWNSF
jgi:hypothetical protein